MATRFAPTLRQLVHAALVCIASHPRIQNPGIYHPIPDANGKYQEIKIERWLDSGGLVLNNPSPGMACAVYPAHTGRHVRRGGPSPSVERNMASALFDTYTLGSKRGGVESATYRLIVELSYQEVSYTGETAKIRYYQSHSWLQDIQHAYRVLFTDNPDYLGWADSPTTYGVQPIQAANPDVFQVREIEVEINAGEAILRDYVDLMRLVINDISVMRPFMTKPGQVTMYDLPTSNPLRVGENIFFHMAYLVWEIHCHVPSSWQEFQPHVDYLNLQVEAERP